MVELLPNSDIPSMHNSIVVMYTARAFHVCLGAPKYGVSTSLVGIGTCKD